MDPEQAQGKVVDYYFSVLSDWAYFGGERFERLARRYGAKINHMPIRLAAVYAGTGGIILQKRSQQRQDYRVIELCRWRDLLGIPINISPKHYPTNDELASCVIIAAKQMDLDAGLLANAILRAIWAEERDIADAETLTRIANGLGFDGAALIAKARGAASYARVRSLHDRGAAARCLRLTVLYLQWAGVLGARPAGFSRRRPRRIATQIARSASGVRARPV